jgi:hypothetical protein
VALQDWGFALKKTDLRQLAETGAEDSGVGCVMPALGEDIPVKKWVSQVLKLGSKMEGAHTAVSFDNRDGRERVRRCHA